MRVDDVVLSGVSAERPFLHKDIGRITIDHHVVVETKCTMAAGSEVRCSLGVPAREECDLVTLTNEFLRQVGDDPFGPAVQLRRDAFPERRQLSDLHGGPFCEKEIRAKQNGELLYYGEEPARLELGKLLEGDAVLPQGRRGPYPRAVTSSPLDEASTILPDTPSGILPSSFSDITDSPHLMYSLLWSTTGDKDRRARKLPSRSTEAQTTVPVGD